jgi:hypothetical protein
MGSLDSSASTALEASSPQTTEGLRRPCCILRSPLRAVHEVAISSIQKATRQKTGSRISDMTVYNHIAHSQTAANGPSKQR